jgi:hypothetical protein
MDVSMGLEGGVMDKSGPADRVKGVGHDWKPVKPRLKEDCSECRQKGAEIERLKMRLAEIARPNCAEGCPQCDEHRLEVLRLEQELDRVKKAIARAFEPGLGGIEDAYQEFIVLAESLGVEVP